MMMPESETSKKMRAASSGYLPETIGKANIIGRRPVLWKKPLYESKEVFSSGQRVTKRSRTGAKVSKSSAAIKNIAYTPVLLLIYIFKNGFRNNSSKRLPHCR